MQESFDVIKNEDQLRQLYAQPMERARLKTLHSLDEHCKNFIGRSPFVCLGTFGQTGGDVTPRGDEPGFVHVLDDATIAIPDWPGNNRLDTLLNIVETTQIALLFFVPGVLETLRLNGTAEIRTGDALLSRWDRNGKRPKTALVVNVREAFLHCGKALIRSKLWTDDYKIERTQMPTYGEMLKDHTHIEDSAVDIQISVEDGYKNRLY